MITCTWFFVSAVLAIGGSTHTEAGGRRVTRDLAGLWFPEKKPSICNNAEGKKDGFGQFPLPVQTFPQTDNREEWQSDYFDQMEEPTLPEGEYLVDGEEILGQPMRKRVAVSPYISFGAFNNLPSFFEQLKESIENQEQQKQQHNAQQQMATAENYNYRPPSTAAVLNAFRNHGFRRTRSYPYPPALVHG